MRKFFWLALILLSFSACVKSQLKYKGLSFVGAMKLPTDSCWQSVKEMNANAITLMPYAYSEEGNSELRTSAQWQWDGESYNGIDSCIKASLEMGITPIVKPHVWIRGAMFTGNMTFSSDTAWRNWFEAYQNYILSFAKLSQQHELPVFCLANEMHSLWVEHPDWFLELIDSCRANFSGKLVYGANWDEYHKFPFWNKLDYIGVNGYFPLENKEKAPAKWKAIFEEINHLADSLNKSVLFTEIGYRSIENPFKTPWESYTEEASNYQAQADAWNIFLEEVKLQPTVAGVFVWKWFPRFKGDRGKTSFSPQFKLAESAIREQFSSM